MEQLTLAQLFGVNCSENGQALVISKFDLPSLTPSVNNSAESLLVAIFLKALENFQGMINHDNNQPITDENNNPLEYDNRDIYEGISAFRWDDILMARNLLYVRHTLVTFSYAPD